MISDITGGDYQDIGLGEESLDTAAGPVVEAYSFGSLPALSDRITRDMTRDMAQTDISPATSDEEIEELADDYAEEIRTPLLAEPVTDRTGSGVQSRGRTGWA